MDSFEYMLYGTLQDEIVTLKLKNEELESQNTNLMLGIAETAEANEQENTNTQLAVAELAEVVMGGVE
ncbi:hypothetical protein [Cytobacillus sp. IB215316]|uniref:hypothetical protein n=1 Tax=Cytobacillus sp. IB215316 TaxID=3097354 RepID=UPI002A143F0E|nr:hypothetical protein [Cytobacillus sp. IB215316]MDX8361637.1 hypothetical protein [Cytobacillus sp. IB215316]